MSAFPDDYDIIAFNSDGSNNINGLIQDVDGTVISLNKYWVDIENITLREAIKRTYKPLLTIFEGKAVYNKYKIHVKFNGSIRESAFVLVSWFDNSIKKHQFFCGISSYMWDGRTRRYTEASTWAMFVVWLEELKNSFNESTQAFQEYFNIIEGKKPPLYWDARYTEINGTQNKILGVSDTADRPGLVLADKGVIHLPDQSKEIVLIQDAQFCEIPGLSVDVDMSGFISDIDQSNAPIGGMISANGKLIYGSREVSLHGHDIDIDLTEDDMELAVNRCDPVVVSTGAPISGEIV